MTTLTPAEVEALRAAAAADDGVLYADDCVFLAASHEALRARLADYEAAVREWAQADEQHDEAMMRLGRERARAALGRLRLARVTLRALAERDRTTEAP